MYRSRVEVAISLLLGFSAVLTAVWPEWIETTFAIAPDGGDGSLEWAVVLALACGALLMALVARRSIRALRATTVGS